MAGWGGSDRSALRLSYACGHINTGTEIRRVARCVTRFGERDREIERFSTEDTEQLLEERWWDCMRFATETRERKTSRDNAIVPK
jgi:hypothetical protein